MSKPPIYWSKAVKFLSKDKIMNKLISKYKDIADISDRDCDRLKAVKDLATIAGMFNVEKKQEQLTVFQGFTQEQMEALGGKTDAKLIAHKEKEED